MLLPEGLSIFLFGGSAMFLRVEIYLTCSSFFLHRSQTTKGIWMAKCVGIEPFTLVMDLEGTDGRERGEVRLVLVFTF